MIEEMVILPDPLTGKWAVCRLTHDEGVGVAEIVPGGLFESIELAKEYSDAPVMYPVVEYSDEQPRDYYGRFSSGAVTLQNPQVNRPHEFSGDHGLSPIFSEADHEEAQRHHVDLAARQGSALNKYEQENVDRYMKDASFANDPLYGLSRTSVDQSRTISTLDNVTKNSKINDNLALYRGVEGDVHDQFKNMKPGQTFDEKGFVSGNVSAKDAAGHLGKDGAFVKISVPRGSRAFANLESPESDVILPRESTYQYIGHSKAVVPGENGAPMRFVDVHHVRLVPGVKEFVQEYSDNQARDSHGRWTSGASLPTALAQAEGHSITNTARDFSNDPHAAQRYANKVSTQHAAGMNWTEHQAVRTFSGDSQNWNSYLRGHMNQEDLEDFGTPMKPEDVHALDSAVSKGVVTEPVNVYRVTSSLPSGLRVGQTFSDKGFTSASYSGEYAGAVHDTRNAFTGEASMVRIDLKPGDKALSSSVMSAQRDQAEVILPRDTKYKVVSIGKQDVNGKSVNVVRVRVVKQ